jgi:hypothetical protein
MPATKPTEHCATIYHRKRHEDWLVLSVPMCSDCLQAGHVQQYLVHYPLLRCCDEKCECPCGHEKELKAA